MADRRACWLLGLTVALASIPLSGRAQSLRRPTGHEPSLKVGQRVMLATDESRPLKVTIVQIGPDWLEVEPNMPQNGPPRRIPAERITEIHRGDSVWDGALIGFASGAGFAASRYKSCQINCYGAFVPVLGGIGAGIGLLVDAMRRTTTLHLASDETQVRRKVLTAPTLRFSFENGEGEPLPIVRGRNAGGRCTLSREVESMTEAVSLKDKTVLVSGGSRGIGLAIALRAAADGANVALAAKTAEPHRVLPGTIYTAAEEVEAAGGHALPIVCDVRDEEQIQSAVDETVAKFGGIDALILNASALSLEGTLDIAMKRFDLMAAINQRGTFLMGKACLPRLIEAKNPHILTISPPLEFADHWWGEHLSWTMMKYSMSLCVRGWAQEFKKQGVAANALWPRTTISTAATKWLGDEVFRCSRKPEIMADAAHWILTQNSRDCSGNHFIDETVLRNSGVSDFDRYANDPSSPPFLDLLVDEPGGNYFRAPER